MCRTLSKDSLKTLGVSCPLLKVLKFERVAEHAYIPSIGGAAVIISETMPRLHAIYVILILKDPMSLILGF